jgi:hypothetical protein
MYQAELDYPELTEQFQCLAGMLSILENYLVDSGKTTGPPVVAERKGDEIIWQLNEIEINNILTAKDYSQKDISFLLEQINIHESQITEAYAIAAQAIEMRTKLLSWVKQKIGIDLWVIRSKAELAQERFWQLDRAGIVVPDWSTWISKWLKDPYYTKLYEPFSDLIIKALSKKLGQVVTIDFRGLVEVECRLERALREALANADAWGNMHEDNRVVIVTWEIVKNSGNFFEIVIHVIDEAAWASDFNILDRALQLGGKNKKKPQGAYGGSGAGIRDMEDEGLVVRAESIVVKNQRIGTDFIITYTDADNLGAVVFLANPEFVLVQKDAARSKTGLPLTPKEVAAEIVVKNKNTRVLNPGEYAQLVSAGELVRKFLLASGSFSWIPALEEMLADQGRLRAGPFSLFYGAFFEGILYFDVPFLRSPLSAALTILHEVGALCGSSHQQNIQLESQFISYVASQNLSSVELIVVMTKNGVAGVESSRFPDGDWNPLVLNPYLLDSPAATVRYHIETCDDMVKLMLIMDTLRLYKTEHIYFVLERKKEIVNGLAAIFLYVCNNLFYDNGLTTVSFSGCLPSPVNKKELGIWVHRVLYQHARFQFDAEEAAKMINAHAERIEIKKPGEDPLDWGIILPDGLKGQNVVLVQHRKQLGYCGIMANAFRVT